MDVVELSVAKHGGVRFDAEDVALRAVAVSQEGGRRYSLGYVVPQEAGTAAGVFVRQLWSGDVIELYPPCSKYH